MGARPAGVKAVKRRIIIADACRVNLEQNKGGINTKVLERYNFSGGTVVLLSSEFGQASYEDPAALLGAFTHFLCEGLDGAADGVGGPKDGVVSVNELYEYAFAALNRWSAQTGKSQFPMKSGEVKGDIPLSYVPGGALVIPLEAEREKREPIEALGELESAVLTPPPATPPAVSLPEIAPISYDWSKGAVRKSVISGHSGSVENVAISPDGKYALTGSYDNTVRLWSMPGGSPVKFIGTHAEAVRSVAFSADGSFAITGSYDKTARIWSMPDGRQMRTLSDRGGIFAVAISPDGKYALTGSDDDTAKLWSVDGGNVVKTLAGHNLWVTSADFSPGGERAVTGSTDTTAIIWSVPEGLPVRTLTGHAGFVLSVAFSPDGRYVLTGGWDKKAIIWSAEDGSHVTTLIGHDLCVNSVAFSPDGRIALTAGDDGSAKFWTVPGGVQVGELKLSGAIFDAEFSPDGRYVVCALGDLVDEGSFMKPADGYVAVMFELPLSG